MLRIAPRLRSLCRVIPEAFCEACIEACRVWASDVIDDKGSLAACRYHVTASGSDSDRLNHNAHNMHIITVLIIHPCILPMDI